MRNPFRSKDSKNKKKDESPEPGSIREPWNREPSNHPPATPRKTIVGKKPDVPFLDKREQRSSYGSGYQCKECSYPLLTRTSVEAPCPNCGFTGDSEAPTETPTPPVGATINLGSLNFGQLSGERKFSLINEANPDMSLNVELGEFQEIVLGRESLDPDNPSISGEEHIQLRENRGQWHVKDISSSGATFIQASDYQSLPEGTRIILGNRRFRFSAGGAPPPGNLKKTVQFGQYDTNASAVTLIDEQDGTPHHFSTAPIELNRSNIDANERSISGKEHARIEHRHGEWVIIDQSSNQATFVQILKEVPLPDQTRLLLGNKIFRFEIG